MSGLTALGLARASKRWWRPAALKDQRKIPAFTFSVTHSRARGADDGGRRRRDASYGVARDSHPVSTIRSGCSLWIPSRHIGGFIRWRVWRVGAEGRAGFFLRDAPAALAACRAKGPSPTAGRSRCVVMVARALNLLLKGSAAPGDPKIASALNLHLKVLRVAQICSSHAHARRAEKSPVH